MRPPRICLPGTVIELTSRVQEGLPFVCTNEMNGILKSILGAVQELYDVTLISFQFMGNHVHLMMYVENPEAICDFMERFKTETAHAVNIRYGLRQKSVWCDSYDSQTILTKEDVIRKLVYHYTNPTQAHLVDKIEDFPGVSSWDMFVKNRTSQTVERIRRPAIRPLRGAIGGLSTSVPGESREKVTIKLSPFAWTRCFPDERTEEELREDLVRCVREREAEIRAERIAKKGRVIGRRALILQSPYKSFRPKKFSRRTWCICSDKVLRIQFIDLIKSLRVRAREVLQLWKCGDLSQPYPIGLFPPSFPRLANPIPPYIEM